MADENDKGLLLGKNVAAVEHYSPEILYPIPRSSARESLGVADSLPFFGEDVWHAYEVSWLDETGKPQVRVGRITIPADSPNLVESKSIKLYLNSFNGEYIADESSVVHFLEKDLSAAAGLRCMSPCGRWTTRDSLDSLRRGQTSTAASPRSSGCSRGGISFVRLMLQLNQALSH